MWRDRRILDLFGIEHPIIQAPMAGAQGSAMAIAVSNAGALGSLPCALLSPDQLRRELQTIRQQTDKPFNLNFFCHTPPAPDAEREAKWVAQLAPYRDELGIAEPTMKGGRAPFDDSACALVEEFRPPIVSFHFGLPDAPLLARVKRTGARVISSATAAAEARWLEARGVDAIIAQGVEAGGHRGMFLETTIAAQVGTFALIPQIVDAVRLPVIAAGGVGDARGVAAALALGAAAVQIGTAYLLCPESTISQLHRAALKKAEGHDTVLTNVFTGRPARGIVNRAIRELGPISTDAPAFPNATNAMLPLRMKAEAAGSADFTSLWSGQAPRLAREVSAGELTSALAHEALALMHAR
jgi:nitronate monooxygenase